MTIHLLISFYAKIQGSSQVSDMYRWYFFDQIYNQRN